MFPEGLGRREAAPVLSLEIHREATANSVDPVTEATDGNQTPTQEEGQRSGPATFTQSMELLLI